MAFSSHSYPSSFSLLLPSPKNPLSPFRLLFFSSSSPHSPHYKSRHTSNNAHHSPTAKTPTTPTAPWLRNWPQSNSPSPRPDVQSPNAPTETRYVDTDKGHSSIDRIVHRLRNLGLGTDDDEEDGVDRIGNSGDLPWEGEEKLSDLLQRSWVRPDMILGSEREENLLPWERGNDASKAEDETGIKRKRVKAPTLAELTIEDCELRRLRREGMMLRERVNVPKAGVTQAVLEKIHQTWRKSELVRLKFHEFLAHDMKTAHEIVEVSWF